MRLHRAGRFEEAERTYRKLMHRHPSDPDVSHFLGVLLHQTGRSEEALQLINQAIVLLPTHPGAHNNLGNVLKELGRFEEAEASYRRAIALQADPADTYNNLGTVLRAQGRLEEALAAYAEAITRDPDHRGAHLNRGNLLTAQGKVAAAIDAYLKAISLAPFSRDAYRNLGSALHVSGRIAEAAAVYDKWLSYEPDDPVALHMRAACSERDVPERASDAYIRAYFDRFADSFDAKLERLEYRAPELTRAAITAGLPVVPNYDVLDVGCGTGLSAPALRPYARRLVGVDLSSGMLEKARHRALYDELIIAELTEYMSGCASRYDLIICVDTLCYFGALQPAFRTAASALRPGGRFAFSLEHAAESTTETHFRLNANGRYSHTERYVRRTLAESGLTLRSISHDDLRKEAGQPVSGLVLLACK
jgi:predicted TPR repeat methyltransferase